MLQPQWPAVTMGKDEPQPLVLVQSQAALGARDTTAPEARPHSWGWNPGPHTH